MGPADLLTADIYEPPEGGRNRWKRAVSRREARGDRASCRPGAGGRVRRQPTRFDAGRRTADRRGVRTLDIAIAKAGVLGRGSTFRDLTPDLVDGVLSVNVGGVVNTLLAAVEPVIASRGQFVQVISVFAFINGAGAIPYPMSKAAVEQLGCGLAVELAPHGVSTMTAHFSLIETDLIRNGVDADLEVLALLAASPDFLFKRIQPKVAAKAITKGLERRKTAIIVPGRWRPVAALRGIAMPLTDRRLARDTAVHHALIHLENR